MTRRSPARNPLPIAKSRRGVSLIELLIVMTTLAVMLSTCTVTLFRLLGAQSAGSAALAASLTTSRLAGDLRRDVHAAAGAKLAGPPDARQLTLTPANGEPVVYSTIPHGIRRSVGDPSQPAAIEEYQLGDVATEIQLNSDGRLIAIRIVKSRSPTAARTVPTAKARELRIEAALPRPNQPATPEASE